MQSLLILGRQPALGLAEVESLYGNGLVKPIGDQAVLVDVDPCLLAFDRLGGSVKFCKLLTSLETSDWTEVEKFLVQVSPEQSLAMPEGKMLLGLSLYGFNLSVKDIMKTGLKLKKAIQKTDRSVRFIPNKAHELNSAQVIHNRLTSPHGWELVLARDGQRTLIAQSVKVQDITAYARRDQQRPNRDARVGMLPPKLAQIIINLSVGTLPPDKLESICDIPLGQDVPPPNLEQTILDPFCGSGVVIQEALLMGYDTLASDLEPRMVDYAKANIDWLGQHFATRSSPEASFKVADATNFQWSQPFDFVASEIYLGRPFTSPPPPEVLAASVNDCNVILKKFLTNMRSQLKPAGRLCLAVPAWQTSPGQFTRLPLIDQIDTLGYNLVSFEHVPSEDLIYFRPNQLVARELLVITKGSST